MSCKDILRREMIEKRQRLNLKNGEKFAEKIRETECYKNAENVMLYMPIKGEADVTELLKDKKTFILPVTKKDMIYPCIYSGSMIKGAFGVPEPEKKQIYQGDIDIVITPGVAFDRNFNRMGFGKGYYDRFLESRKCIKIGVCHSFQLKDEIEHDAHDVKMDMIVTEDNVWIRENI